jgi:hypothetical protein
MTTLTEYQSNAGLLLYKMNAPDAVDTDRTPHEEYEPHRQRRIALRKEIEALVAAVAKDYEARGRAAVPPTPLDQGVKIEEARTEGYKRGFEQGRREGRSLATPVDVYLVQEVGDHSSRIYGVANTPEEALGVVGDVEDILDRDEQQGYARGHVEIAKVPFNKFFPEGA